MLATEIIVKPLITEKSNHQANTRNTYSFHVSPRATKPQIKRAVEELYNVKVADVRTMIRKGKSRRTRAGYSRGTDMKRAIVTLHEDSKIDLF
ncbi:MAG: 50S ribosomal protein L23 [Phycisphaerae bacterium]|nr:50S ribosomal protein L23 [Phycisphaerae bacterium]MDW8262399.1 50S ribosomal protein L23 [Phycisphaerales bacterium]